MGAISLVGSLTNCFRIFHTLLESRRLFPLHCNLFPADFWQVEVPQFNEELPCICVSNKITAYVPIATMSMSPLYDQLSSSSTEF